MIYYYIPDFVGHLNINLCLLEMIDKMPHMFYDDFKIGAVFGNAPNCIWNGGSDYKGVSLLSGDMIRISEMFNKYNVPLRLTMTNPILEETDCYDRYSNYIMRNLNNGFNQVLVSNNILEEYIRNKYPEYPIVRSILAAENQYYDDSDKYFMSVLRKHKNDDIEFLKSIKNKDKIEILVNETCDENCPRAYSHYLDHAKIQLYLDDCTEIVNNGKCSANRMFPRKKFYESDLCITRDKIKNIYEPLGFKHFKISGRGNKGKVILDYAHYMVKPEWKEDFIYMIMDAIIADNR